MGELSPWHWAIVIGVAVLLFGGKRLPDAARSLGRSARILKAELRADTPAAAGPGMPAPAAPAPDAASTPAAIPEVGIPEAGAAVSSEFPGATAPIASSGATPA
jgi:sec-independent protein translocase protein TatA